MLQKPLISIAIPTKNRPTSLHKNIQACFNQTYTNFEIVIAENSDDDAASHSIVAQYNDPRIRYIRTGGLSMPNNWQASIDACSGELIFPIGDKIILHKNALKNILVGCNLHAGVSIFSFLHSSMPDTSFSVKEGSWDVYDTSMLTSSAFSGDISPYNYYGMRGYSIAFKKDLFDFLKNKYSSITLPFSPDFTLAYILTLHAEKFAFCSHSFWEYDNQASSNGFSCAYGGKLAKSFQSDIELEESEKVSHVPLKVQSIWNSVLNDFFRVCDHVGRSYNINDIDIVPYWKNVYSEVLACKNLLHVDKTCDFIILYDFLQENNLAMNPEILAHMHSNCVGAVANKVSERRVFYLLIKKVLNRVRKWL